MSRPCQIPDRRLRLLRQGVRGPPAHRGPAGLLPEARLNDAVFRVMRDRIRLGELTLRAGALQQDPHECDLQSGAPGAGIKGGPGIHRAAGQPEQLLPLDKNKFKTIAVIGPMRTLLRPAATAARRRNRSSRFRASATVLRTGPRCFTRADARSPAAPMRMIPSPRLLLPPGCGRGDCVCRHQQ